MRTVQKVYMNIKKKNYHIANEAQYQQEENCTNRKSNPESWE